MPKHEPEPVLKSFKNVHGECTGCHKGLILVRYFYVRYDGGAPFMQSIGLKKQGAAAEPFDIVHAAVKGHAHEAVGNADDACGDVAERV